MIVEPGSQDWRDTQIHEWLLLLLRFAVTREPSDSAAALVLATELDSVGLCWQPGAPSFFQRTSKEVCAAIRTADGEHTNAVLQRHIARIDDPRLRQAFAAVVGLKRSIPQERMAKRTKRNDTNLWRGLSRK